MGTFGLAVAVVSTLSLLVWVLLLLARGGYWRTDQLLPEAVPDDQAIPRWTTVAVVIPARNEADVISETLKSVLNQDYPGSFHIYLVDDGSDDDTSDTARRAVSEAGLADRLTILAGRPLEDNWTGKLWALQQGIEASEPMEPMFYWFTDADISHPPDSLRRLVVHAQEQRLDIVSLMARLRIETFWERLMIPAFVYFFAKVYPFRWVNDRRRKTAAAAGGCVLVRREALEDSDGLASMSNALIDDCALADRIKNHGKSPRGGRIWLGLSQDVHSVREYNGLSPIWDMIARTAFAQLNFKALALIGTVLGMLLIYLVPPITVFVGLGLLIVGDFAIGAWVIATGFGAWLIMSGSYIPQLRWHGTTIAFAPLLAVIGVVYTLIIVASAMRWWRGKGGAWKGRTY